MRCLSRFATAPGLVCAGWMLFALVLGTASLRPVSAAEPITILQGATVIDGTGQPPVKNQAIWIQGDKILRVADAGQEVPKGAKVIDCRGKTIIPGLISAHSHLGQIDGARRGPEHFTRDNVIRQLRQYQAYGVTTVVSLGTNLPLFYALRDEAREGKLPGADPLGADRGFGTENGAPGVLLQNKVDQIDRPQTPEEARAAVRAAHARGTDYIKMWVDSRNTMPTISPPVYKAVIDEAHRLKLQVFAHIYTLHDAKALVDSGLAVIAHGVRDKPVDEAFIAAMKAKDTGYIATLALDDAFYIYADRPAWMEQPFFQHAVQPELKKQLDDPRWREQTLADRSLNAAREAVRMNQRNLVTLYRAGVRVGFGTDSGAFPLRIPGFAEHRELDLMIEAGLTPLEAITIATGDTAKLLKLDDRGVLAAGKRADLLILDGDPTADPAALHRIDAVWQRGQRVAGPVTEFTP